MNNLDTKVEFLSLEVSKLKKEIESIKAKKAHKPEVIESKCNCKKDIYTINDRLDRLELSISKLSELIGSIEKPKNYDEQLSNLNQEIDKTKKMCDSARRTYGEQLSILTIKLNEALKDG